MYYSGSQPGAILPFREHLTMSGDNSGCHIWTGGASGFAASSQGCCETPTMHRTAFPQQRSISAEVEKLWCRDEEEFWSAKGTGPGVRGPHIQPLLGDLEKVISHPLVSDDEKVELNDR